LTYQRINSSNIADLEDKSGKIGQTIVFDGNSLKFRNFPTNLYCQMNSNSSNVSWVPYCVSAVSFSSVSMTAGQIIWIPFSLYKDLSLTSLSIYVSSAKSSSTAQIGIYDADNTGPTNLLASTNSFNTNSTGIKKVSVSYSLKYGKNYFMALYTSDAISVYGVPVTALNPMLGYNLGNTAYNCYLYKTSQSSLPSSIDGSTLSTKINSAPPAIYVQGTFQ
jgi:hypothetical protein